MTIPIWMRSEEHCQAGRTRLDADLIIVGAGLLGAAAAYFAATMDASLKIIVVEAGRAAAAASGRNAGFVLRGIHSYYDSCVAKYGRETARLIYRLGEENQRLIREFMDSHGLSLGYEPGGSYVLASSLEELDALSRSAQLMQEDGFNLKLHLKDPLDRGFYGAIENPDDFGIDPVKLVRTLLAASDARVLEEEPVLSLEADGEVELASTGYVLSAPRAILATNAYTASLEPLFMPYIKAVRGQMLATAPLKKRLVDKLCYANYGFEYFRQLKDMRLLLGGGRQAFAEEEVGLADEITPALQRNLEEYLRERFPEAAGAHIEHRWSGAMAFTHDGLPYVGGLPGRPGLFAALGCNGHGLGYSMSLGRLVSEAALKGADTGCFSLERLNKKPARQDRLMAQELKAGP